MLNVWGGCQGSFHKGTLSKATAVVWRPAGCQVTEKDKHVLDSVGFLSKDWSTQSSLMWASLNGNPLGNVLSFPSSVQPSSSTPVLSEGHPAVGQHMLRWRGRKALCVWNPHRTKPLSASVVCHPSLAGCFQMIHRRPWCLLETLIVPSQTRAGSPWDFSAAS